MEAFRKAVQIYSAASEFQAGVAGIKGNVDPDTKSRCARAINGGHIHGDSVGTGTRDLGEVTDNSQRVVALLDLSRAAFDQMDTALGVTDRRGYGPTVGDPKLLGLVLEGTEQVGSSSEGDGDLGGQPVGGGGQDRAIGSGILRARRKVRAVDAADEGIRQGEGHLTVLQDDAVALIGGVQRDLVFFPVGNCQRIRQEGQGVGSYDIDGILANGLAVHEKLHGNGAFLTARHEYAVGYSTHGGIRQLPDRVGGNIRGHTIQIHALGVEADGTAGGIVIGVCRNVSLDKLTLSGRGRNDQNTVRGGTLHAVGGRAVHLQLLAGTLGQEGGGSAAVAVDRLYATQGDHEFRHLVTVETAGEGLLAALVHNDDDGSVCFDTQNGAGSSRFGIIDDVLVDAVFDQEMEAGGNKLFFPSCNGIIGLAHLGLGNMGRTGLAVLFVKVDHKTSVGPEIAVLAVSVVLTVHDQRAERLADQLGMLLIVIGIVPMQCRIHGRDHVAVAVLLGVLGLLGHDLSGIILVIQPLFHLMVTGHDFGVGVIGIHLYHMAYLTLRAVLLGQNDFGFGNARSQIPIALGDHFQIVAIFLGVLNGKHDH